MTKHVYRLSVEIRTDEPFEDIHDSVHAGLFVMRFPRDYSTTIRDESYNGWSNRETWALNLWLTNDQGLYEITRERVSQAVREHKGDTYYPYAGTGDEKRQYESRIAGEAVKDLWEEMTDPDEGYMSAAQALETVRDVGSDYRVDWDEIGAAWFEDVTECPIEGDE